MVDKTHPPAGKVYYLIIEFMGSSNVVERSRIARVWWEKDMIVNEIRAANKRYGVKECESLSKAWEAEAHMNFAPADPPVPAHRPGDWLHI